MTELNDRGMAFRSTIAAFIEGRREAKQKGKENDAGMALKYDYTSWLADAARRVGQIQVVTHVLKATHPDARGSSLYAAPGKLPQHAEIGTHALGENYAEDVVGNAAALDVYKFLRIEIDGHRLLDWMQAGDTDLRCALHQDAIVAAGWMEAFSNLMRSDPAPSSHAAAKQIYWLIGEQPSNDTDYHLLQPQFSSSLAHAMHADIQDARFGEVNKLARRAFRVRESYDLPYRDYRNLVVRKLGGTKPQNISQLNSERGGVNYLLASLPPKWTRESPQNLLRVESALERFTYFEGVRPLVKLLSSFLLSDPNRNIETRDKRKAIEQALGSKLSIFTAGIHAHLEPGWTHNPDCQLPLCERLWLDPDRVELPARKDHEQEDEDFKVAYNRGDWLDDVSARFSNWINAQLRAAGLTTVGDDEHRHWTKRTIVDATWPAPLRGGTSIGGQA